ncbi:MAG: leucine dehydrogenase, partial [Myxococcota bacterium]
MSRARVQLADVSRDYSIAAGCDAVYEVTDADMGVVGFIALHDLTRGPGFGGVRRLRYASKHAAVRDVVMLAEQMTLKTTLANLPVGGAKGALVDRPGLDVERAYEALGDAVAELDGAYFCGPDVGTGATELSYVRRRTDFVNHLHNQPASSTAKGVLLACEAALAHVAVLEGETLRFEATVQGVGSVGRVVAEGLEIRGGRLAIADIDPDRVNAVMQLLNGATLLSPD